MTSEIPIEVFSHPSHDWYALNDPVMGGKSTGSVEIDATAGVGIFDGEVVDVPFLHAPGFIQMSTRGGTYPDISSCTGIKMTMTSTTPDYTGYRVSFGNVHVPGGRYAMGYKANFNAPDGAGTVTIPLDQFTAKWNDETGDADVTCAEDAQYCPDNATLQSMETFAIWGEGVAGNIHLEVASIAAVHCSDEEAVVGAADQRVVPQEAAEAVARATVANEEHEIVIEDFADPVLHWSEMNDPVMGGKSTGTFTLDAETKTGHFKGEVAIVSFLQAPGFIQAIGKANTFADVSSCSGIKLVVRTGNEKMYTGYRLGFGLKKPPHAFQYTHGFKSQFEVPPSGGEFMDITLPFHQFSDKWDAGTGDIITTCAEDAAFCPDEETLQNMKELTIWGEGVEGDVDLHVKSILGVGCTHHASEQQAPDTYLQQLSVQREEEQTGHAPRFGKHFLSPLVMVAFVAAIALVQMMRRNRKKVTYNQIENVEEESSNMPQVV